MRTFFFLLVSGIAWQAQAAIFVVVNGNDSGTGSLREAIIQANASPGCDSIFFNILNTDPSYSSSEGTFSISLLTLLPYLTDATCIEGETQTQFSGNTNVSGPEVIITTQSALVTWAFGVFCSNCHISGLIMHSFTYAILLSEPTSLGNTISENFIGVDFDGVSAKPNQYGILLNNGVQNTIISNNLISGNTTAGIMIVKADNNLISQNLIGTDISGTFAIANGNGIHVDSSSHISILNHNVISGNAQNGVLISGKTSSNNIISNNIIGADISGQHKISNLYGITLAKVAGNTIGPGNVISGNTDIGVLLTGKYTCNNSIVGNRIGTDSSGTKLLDNQKGIVIKSLANNNRIGGSSSADRNIISGNIEIGVYIEAADSNVIAGNYIGTDITGMNKIAVGTVGMNDSLVQGNGVEFNVLASHNVLGGSNNAERNIISGHKVYGVVYYGHCNNNSTINNFIGTDVTGRNPLPNATGICFDCASNHNDVINCVLSGNIGYGLFYVTRGTEFNRLLGCKIGTDSSGTMAVPNDIGMVVSTGAANNIIGGSKESERNIFSGNTQSGLMITNQLTENNIIKNNYFGTDVTGMFALPNLYGVLLSTYTAHNILDSNLISGNLQAGIIVTEQADSNTITRNKIGTDVSGLLPLENGAGGIYIDQGASNNFIGSADSANLIAFNSGGGILVRNEHCLGNRLSGNSFFENLGLAIDIFPFGMINLNDSGDNDTGPASQLNFPVIETASFDSNSGSALISGNIDVLNQAASKIEIYIAEPDTSGHGQGKVFIGTVVPNAGGEWTIISNMLNGSELLTALCIDEVGNTSEFSANKDVVAGLVTNNEIHCTIGPNPCSDYIVIVCSTCKKALVSVYSTDGRLMLQQSAADGLATVSLSGLVSGSYIVVVHGLDGSHYSQKLIKQ